MRYQGDTAQLLPQLLAQGETWTHALTSPPYYRLISYGSGPEEIGHSDLDTYLDQLTTILGYVWDGMVEDGVLFLNLGDTRSNHSYVRDRGRTGQILYRRGLEPGTKRGSLLNVPARLLERLKAHGWHHAHTDIWDKGANATSQPKDGRPRDTHEPIFYLVKSTRSRPRPLCQFWGGSVFCCPPVRSAFPCAMPPQVADHCLRQAIAPTHGSIKVIDPFCGSGTTLTQAEAMGYEALGIDLGEVAA